MKLAVTEPEDEADQAAATPASTNPDIYTLTVRDVDVAPVAKFKEPNFTLAEQSIRVVHLDVGGPRGARIPGIVTQNDGPYDAATDVITIRVDNPQLVMFGNGTVPAESCPPRSDTSRYNRILFRIDTGEAVANGGSPFGFSQGWVFPANANDSAFRNAFLNTGVLKTSVSIRDLAANVEDAAPSADHRQR